MRRFRCQGEPLCIPYRGLRWYAGFPYGNPRMTPRAGCAYEAPAPRLSFSCVKKKDGGERKSLRGTIRRAWGDTPHWKNVAAPRSSSPHRGNKTLLKPLCRCGLRSPTREIQTFSARVAAGAPANAHAAAAFCFLPAPPRACVTTRTEKSGDQLPRGSAAQGEQRDKGGRSALAGLAGLGRRAHTEIRKLAATL